MALRFGLKLGLGTGISAAISSTISWLLSFNLNGTATVGDSVTNASTSATTVHTYDATDGLILQTTPSGTFNSEGMRLSYDTDEATLGLDLVDTMNTAAAWTASGSNTVSDDGGWVKITYVDAGLGALTNFNSAKGLTENIVVGATYTLTGLFKVNIGSVSSLTNPTSTEGTQAITSTVGEPITHTFVATSATGNDIRFGGMAAGEIVYVKDLVFQKITPAFLNDTAKDSGIKLTPSKTDAETGAEIFLVFQPWTNGATVPAGGYLTDFDGVQCKYYKSATGGTTSGTGVADDTGVTDWVAQGNYNNIQQVGWNGYLTHVLNEPVAINLFLNSEAPVTQNITTTAQNYTVSVWGTGSITLSGTATGVATQGSPLTVTASAGTLTCTVAGSLDMAQVETGDNNTSFIVTLGGSAQRNATSFTVVNPLPVNDFQMRGRGVFRDNDASSRSYLFYEFYDANNSLSAYVDSSTGIVVALQSTAGFKTSTVAGTFSDGDTFNWGLSLDNGTLTASIDGAVDATPSTGNADRTLASSVFLGSTTTPALHSRGVTDFTINTGMSAGNADWYKQTDWSDPE